jgi:hypothetical protein
VAGAPTPRQQPRRQPLLATGDDGSCAAALSGAEVESIFGTPVDMPDNSSVCNVVFRDNAVGTFQIWSGARADEAMEVLVPQFQADERASANVVLLDDGRGFVYEESAVVLGDSGRVFRFDTPPSVFDSIAEAQVAMEASAALLLTR